jgi:conjugative transposon TraJ protein
MCKRAAILAVVGMLFPFLSHAQSTGGGLASTIGGLQGVLDTLYDQMMPKCSKLIGVGRGIAGFAATWYIASRVWRHIANAEPVDFYPLFRPFVLGFCIAIFPQVIGLINGVMQPTVTGTASMVTNANDAIAALLKQKEDALKNTDTYKMYVGANGEGDKELWYKYTNSSWSVTNDISFALDKAYYNLSNTIQQWMSQILQILFQAAALCINTLRTFQLIVLAILGPLVFGIAVFDGFQHTLTAWIARYINIFLWLPVCNLFGAVIAEIQVQMLTRQVAGQTGFDSADAAYLVFMLIGIVGYFTVPSVANSIVHAGGLGSMLQKVTNLSVGNVSSRAAETGKAITSIPTHFMNGYNEKDRLSGGKGASGGSSGTYMKDKLSGKSDS